MGYYDIEDILADGEKIPCKFNLTVPGLGYLEGSPGKAIENGTKLDLPMWLAEVLAVCSTLENTQDTFIELLEPDFIAPKVMNAIRADPKAVDLHSIMANYYKLCEKWSAMFNEKQLVEAVMVMLKERAMEIDSYASNATKYVSTPFLLSLDEFEKDLYKVTYESKKLMRHWNNE